MEVNLDFLNNDVDTTDMIWDPIKKVPCLTLAISPTLLPLTPQVYLGKGKRFFVSHFIDFPKNLSYGDMN